MLVYFVIHYDHCTSVETDEGGSKFPVLFVSGLVGVIVFLFAFAIPPGYGTTQNTTGVERISASCF